MLWSSIVEPGFKGRCVQMVLFVAVLLFLFGLGAGFYGPPYRPFSDGLVGLSYAGFAVELGLTSMAVLILIGLSAAILFVFIVRQTVGLPVSEGG